MKVFLALLASLVSLAMHPLTCVAKEHAKQVALQGAVCIDHPMGTLYAEHIFLSSPGDSKELFSRVELKDGVKIVLKNGSSFICGQGELDWEKKIGKFSGPPQCQALLCSEGDDEPLFLAASHLDLLLNSEVKAPPEKIFAEEEVVISWGDFTAIGHSAVYSLIEGKVSLYQADEKHSCLILCSNGEVLACESIEFFLSSAVFKAFNFYGVGTASAASMAVSGHVAQGSNNTKKLMLFGSAALYYGALGVLTSEQIDFSFGLGTFSTLHAQGPAKFLYNSKELSYLLAPGGITIDRDGEIAVAKSVPLSGKQVLLYTPQGRLAADSISLSLAPSKESGRLEAKKLEIDGVIKMISIPDSESDEGLRAAIADHFEYDFIEEKLLLQALQGRVVTIFDQENSVVASATAFHLLQQPERTKPMITGEGDVNFRFVKEQEVVPFAQDCFKLLGSDYE